MGVTKTIGSYELFTKDREVSITADSDRTFKATFSHSFPRYSSDIIEQIYDELSKMDYQVFVGDKTIDFLDYPCISILAGEPRHSDKTAFEIPITINFYVRRELESDTEMIDHEEQWEEISWRVLEAIKSIWNVVHYRLDRNEQIQAATEGSMIVLYQMTYIAKRNVGLHPMYG